MDSHLISLISFQLFPRILSSVSPYFSLPNCNYTMEKSKEATARIVGFRGLGIERSYTLESSYCGLDQGEFAVSSLFGFFFLQAFV